MIDCAADHSLPPDASTRMLRSIGDHYAPGYWHGPTIAPRTARSERHPPIIDAHLGH